MRTEPVVTGSHGNASFVVGVNAKFGTDMTIRDLAWILGSTRLVRLT